MNKKLFTIALSAIMVIAMAVPTIASTSPEPRVGKQYWANLQNIGTRHGNETEFLNIYRAESGPLYSEKNITTYDSRSSDDQIFQVHIYNDGYVISRVTGPNLEVYALNVYWGTNPYNCTLYPLVGNYNDALMKMTAGEIMAVNHNLRRLTVTGDNGNVYWLNGVNSNSYWDMFNTFLT